MKKKIIGLLMMALMIGCMTMPIYADTLTGNEDWNVTFTQENEMVSTFKTSDIDDVMWGLQPGDNAIITLSLQSTNNETTDWYMTNKVLRSLEETTEIVTEDGQYLAGGGAYTYRLVYTNVNGEENVLFDSETVGGEDTKEAGEGLNEATNALEDFFYLDTLEKGQSGVITLEVALEGETQGNDYQDTLADLQMNFAVELNTTEGGKTSVVQTGDDGNLWLGIGVALVSGILLLIFGIYSLKHRKIEKGGAAR